MKTVTIASKLTEKMAETIDELIKEGVYANRSDAVRDAVRLQIGMYRGIISGQRLNTESGTSKQSKNDKDRILNNFLKKKGWQL